MTTASSVEHIWQGPYFYNPNKTQNRDFYESWSTEQRMQVLHSKYFQKSCNLIKILSK